MVILGHNGCGKSTLAKHFNAILLPSGGEIFVYGMDTRQDADLIPIRRSVGLVFQNPDNQIDVYKRQASRSSRRRRFSLDALMIGQSSRVQINRLYYIAKSLLFQVKIKILPENPENTGKSAREQKNSPLWPCGPNYNLHERAGGLPPRCQSCFQRLRTSPAGGLQMAAGVQHPVDIMWV